MIRQNQHDTQATTNQLIEQTWMKQSKLIEGNVGIKNSGLSWKTINKGILCCLGIYLLLPFGCQLPVAYCLLLPKFFIPTLPCIVLACFVSPSCCTFSLCAFISLFFYGRHWQMKLEEDGEWLSISLLNYELVKIWMRFPSYWRHILYVPSLIHVVLSIG